MGERGPIPERSDAVQRRNKPDTPVDKVPVFGAVVVPELGLKNPHPLTVDLYTSMKDSGQSKFYEPSDWESARIAMHFLDKLLKKANPSAMMLTTVNQMLSNLLLTEGERRRVRMEVERKPDGPAAPVLSLTDRFEAHLKQQR